MFFQELRSRWRRLKKNIIYRLASILFSQDKLILFSSSQDDKFCNISVLAKVLCKNKVPFIKLTQQQFITYPYRALTYLARAKVLVIDAASPAAYVKLHKNTCLIHCWHAGGAYKKVAFDAKRKYYDQSSEEKRIARIHSGISWFVCTSKATAEIYAKAFRLPLERMLVFGSPRLDACLQCTTFPAPSIYTVLYAPTYRTNDKKTRCTPVPPDGEALRTALISRLGENVQLVFRVHPTTPPPEDLRGWTDWSHIPQHEALCRASVLITDYSSIFFDFLPFKRPIIFYVPDFNRYIDYERELYFSPYDIFPETTCSNEQALIELLEQYRYKETDYSEIWEKYMSACDGKASERLCSFIQNIMRRNAQ